MNKISFSGQWIGYWYWLNDKNEESRNTVVMNIDEDRKTHGFISITTTKDFGVNGNIYLYQNNESIDGEILNIFAFDANGLQTKSQSAPVKIITKGVISNQTYKGMWSAETGAGRFEIFLQKGISTKKEVKTISWKQYKEWAEKIYKNNPNVLFRGHSCSSYQLRSSLHRTGRYDLSRYLKDDIPELLRHVENETGLHLSDQNPTDLGLLLNLAQHHGFPTPLIDWSDSPFIAAFFAFRSQHTPQHSSGKVRVFAAFQGLTNKLSRNNYSSLVTPRPFFDHLKLPTRNNSRVLPQQASLTCSNIFAIEEMIDAIEKSDNKEYMDAVDIEITERNEAIADLRMMGISAASLFPGLDGVCESLSSRLFAR